jgi:hypothetical protein
LRRIQQEGPLRAKDFKQNSTKEAVDAGIGNQT